MSKLQEQKGDTIIRYIVARTQLYLIKYSKNTTLSNKIHLFDQPIMSKHGVFFNVSITLQAIF